MNIKNLLGNLLSMVAPVAELEAEQYENAEVGAQAMIVVDSNPTMSAEDQTNLVVGNTIHALRGKIGAAVDVLANYAPFKTQLQTLAAQSVQTMRSLLPTQAPSVDPKVAAVNDSQQQNDQENPSNPPA